MLLKRIISIAAAAIAAAAMLISLTACGKENVVNTDEGKKLTAHAWQTNYTGHSEVTFETDGTLKVPPLKSSLKTASLSIRRAPSPMFTRTI